MLHATGGSFLTHPMDSTDMNFPQADIPENSIQQLSCDLLRALLIDHTTSTPNQSWNIFWATHDYEHLGEGYQYFDPIDPERITGENGHIIMPRVLKARDTQQGRVQSMAEVFTPAWVCNAQNNIIDKAWFGRSDVFNHERLSPDGRHYWIANPQKITFPEGKTWLSYVRDTRLEITCGEAPYIVSRYDASTGDPIPLEQRVGILDRKLRVVSENTTTSGEWLKAAQLACMSTYAYEWQGDNLLLAREAMLISVMEYYQHKFGRPPLLRSLMYFAYIISWNVWQMDGLKGVVPCSCGVRKSPPDLWGESHDIPCSGCLGEGIMSHNGIYCQIRDWTKKKSCGRIRFVDLLNQ